MLGKEWVFQSDSWGKEWVVFQCDAWGKEWVVFHDAWGKGWGFLLIESHPRDATPVFRQ